MTSLIHAVTLDAAGSPELLDRYRHCVIAFTSDKGVESGIATAPTVDKDAAQEAVPLQATKKVKTVLAHPPAPPRPACLPACHTGPVQNQEPNNVGLGEKDLV